MGRSASLLFTLLQVPTYDGIFPAPNAWTPLPGRKTTKIARKIKETDLETDMLDQIKWQLNDVI
jgi:hypothetical protein